MANQILFAIETVKTSQGWFEPGQLLPKEDTPADEIDDLIAAGKVGRCAFDSPLAQLVHEARKSANKDQSAKLLKGAVGSVSAESQEGGLPPGEAAGDDVTKDPAQVDHDNQEVTGAPQGNSDTPNTSLEPS